MRTAVLVACLAGAIAFAVVWPIAAAREATGAASPAELRATP